MHASVRCLACGQEFQAQKEAREAGAANSKSGASLSEHFVNVLVGIGGVIAFAVFQYGGMVWTNSFLEKHGAPANMPMLAGMCSRVLQMVLSFFVGWFADCYGVALVTLASGAMLCCAGAPFFFLLASYPDNVANIFLIYGVGYGIIGAMVGTVVFMYCAELFPTSVRNLGVGISYNIGFSIFGGFAPLVAEASLGWSLYGPGLLLSAAGLLTLLTVVISMMGLRAGKLKLAYLRPELYFGMSSKSSGSGSKKPDSARQAQFTCVAGV